MLPFYCGAQEDNVKCGSNRVKIKTCSDVFANKIDTVPKRISIKRINSLIAPQKISNKMARTDIELNTYKVQGKIIYWSKEEDGDYHIVLQSLTYLI